MQTVIEENSGKRGRKPGLKYKLLDMKEFLWEHGLEDILFEHGELTKEIALVENLQLTKTSARALYEPVILNETHYKGVVELSTKVLYEGTVEAQKVAFVRAISHFIAYKVFKQSAGLEYSLFVKRYLTKRNKAQEPHISGHILRVN